MQFVIVLITLAIILWWVIGFILTSSIRRAYDAKDYDRALLFLRYQEMMLFNRFQMFHKRGHVYQNLGQIDAAIRDFKQSIKLNKWDAEVYGCLLSAFMEAGKVQLFEPYFFEIMALRPHDAKSYSVVGRYHNSLEQTGEALANFTRAQELDPINPVYPTNLALTYLKMDRIDEAVNMLESVHQEFPTDWRIQQIFALAKSRQENYDEALHVINQTISNNPANDYNLYLRAYVYRKQERYSDAFKDINRSLEINPRSWSAFAERGVIYYLMEDYPKASVDFSKAIELAPFESCPYVDRAMVFVLQDQLEDAHTDALKGYEIDEESIHAIGMLSVTKFLYDKDNDGAKVLWQKLVEKDTRYTDLEWAVDKLGWQGSLVANAKSIIGLL